MSKTSSLIAILIVIVSCGGTETLGPTTSSTTSSNASSAVTTTTVQVATTAPALPLTPTTVLPEDATLGSKTVEEWNRIVEAVRADLSDRLGVDPTGLETESVETGVWRDGSIGCPEPDSVYTQALVPGSRIVLRAGEDTYEYHQAGSDDPFLCESPTDDAFKGEEGDVLLPPPRYDE